MNNHTIFKILVMAFFFQVAMSSLMAQRSLDTLKIYDEGEVVMEVAVSADQNISFIQQEIDFLLNAFAKHLSQVIDSVPVFENYLIEYQINKSLRVEERSGLVRYRVDSAGVLQVYPDNIANLYGTQSFIRLYLPTLETLDTYYYRRLFLDQYANIQVESRSKSTGRSSLLYTFPRPRKKRTKKIDVGKPRKANLLLGLDASIGILNNRPIYEYGVGVGVRFNNYQYQDLLLFLSRQHQYLDERELITSRTLLGLHYRPSKYFSVEASTILSGSLYSRPGGWRFGLSVYPIRGISITPVFYTSHISSFRIRNYGINIGYGI